MTMQPMRPELGMSNRLPPVGMPPQGIPPGGVTGMPQGYFGQTPNPSPGMSFQEFMSMMQAMEQSPMRSRPQSPFQGFMGRPPMPPGLQMPMRPQIPMGPQMPMRPPMMPRPQGSMPMMYPPGGPR